jgi:hypothetical protein
MEAGHERLDDGCSPDPSGCMTPVPIGQCHIAHSYWTVLQGTTNAPASSAYAISVAR